ncbi:uncharacterized protein MONBRDRAFT_22911 [Monosiga brevicollis MX1]|uniref:Uncharacterized protein n=1 Tax=Monosiga brevicollis TaxID=81824 RepID=A9USF5_MONBE|nr:uncharacterized protein MONBRDRAFT_22911 [Monosiga brevicollis MX1]EDQ91770.1 predicted protein [Monosiga brevicollis MX1]|eukprot:XP_001743056.1 hypothetical protein [Monosiga brevicollis MX1]
MPADSLASSASFEPSFEEPSPFHRRYAMRRRHHPHLDFETPHHAMLTTLADDGLAFPDTPNSSTRSSTILNDSDTEQGPSAADTACEPIAKHMHTTSLHSRLGLLEQRHSGTPPTHDLAGPKRCSSPTAFRHPPPRSQTRGPQHEALPRLELSLANTLVPVGATVTVDGVQVSHV